MFGVDFMISGSVAGFHSPSLEESTDILNWVSSWEVSVHRSLRLQRIAGGVSFGFGIVGLCFLNLVDDLVSALGVFSLLTVALGIYFFRDVQKREDKVLTVCSACDAREYVVAKCLGYKASIAQRNQPSNSVPSITHFLDARIDDGEFDFRFEISKAVFDLVSYGGDEVVLYIICLENGWFYLVTSRGLSLGCRKTA